MTFTRRSFLTKVGALLAVATVPAITTLPAIAKQEPSKPQPIHWHPLDGYKCHYYVDLDRGNDNNDGLSVMTPKRTISGAFRCCTIPNVSYKVQVKFNLFNLDDIFTFRHIKVVT